MEYGEYVLLKRYYEALPGGIDYENGAWLQRDFEFQQAAVLIKRNGRHQTMVNTGLIKPIDFPTRDYIITDFGIRTYLEETAKLAEATKTVSKGTDRQIIINGNSNVVNQDLDLRESALIQTHTITPSPKESKEINARWYNSALFKYGVWPLLITVAGGILLYLITKS